LSASHIICVVLPLKIISEANGREHWRKKAARVRNHRRAAMLGLNAVHPDWFPESATVTLTRISPRTLDDDNLASGFKAVRDGVADWLGIDDGDKRLTWRYAQRKGRPKEYAAEVVIESEMLKGTA
jgi:hypothetical protein